MVITNNYLINWENRLAKAFLHNTKYAYINDVRRLNQYVLCILFTGISIKSQTAAACSVLTKQSRCENGLFKKSSLRQATS